MLVRVQKSLFFFPQLSHFQMVLNFQWNLIVFISYGGKKFTVVTLAQRVPLLNCLITTKFSFKTSGMHLVSGTEIYWGCF